MKFQVNHCTRELDSIAMSSSRKFCAARPWEGWRHAVSFLILNLWSPDSYFPLPEVTDGLTRLQSSALHGEAVKVYRAGRHAVYFLILHNGPFVSAARPPVRFTLHFLNSWTIYQVNGAGKFWFSASLALLVLEMTVGASAWVPFCSANLRRFLPPVPVKNNSNLLPFSVFQFVGELICYLSCQNLNSFCYLSTC